MKKYAFQILFLAILVLGCSAGQAWAQKPLKGSWTVTVTTPMGALPVPFTFKAAGKGSLASPTGTLPLAYREKGANISISFEGPGLSPDGGDLSIVVRGTKTDSDFTAVGIAITDNADPANPTGFVVVQLPVTAKRNK